MELTTDFEKGRNWTNLTKVSGKKRGLEGGDNLRLASFISFRIYQAEGSWREQ